MKELTISYDVYKLELEIERHRGRKEGLAEGRRIAVELLAGASIENISDISSDEALVEIAKDLKPRIDRARGIL